ncbi:AAA domain-containing protein [Halocola ammonii]
MKKSVDELMRVGELLRKEKQTDLEQYIKIVKESPIQERKESGLSWYPVKVVNTGFGLGSYPFIVVERNVNDRQPHHFQTGSPVSIFSTDEEDNEAQGVINFVDEQRIKVTFYKDDLPSWIREEKIGLNALFDTKTYEEMERALGILISAERGREADLRDIILGESPAKWQNVSYVFQESLNQSQNEAVKTALEAEDIAVIHGPPGTGKSTTLNALVRELARRDLSVLVCAPSNASVDHLTRLLSDGNELSVVRVGNLSRIDDDVADRTLEMIIRDDKEYKSVREFKKKAIEFRRMAGKYKRNFGKSERDQRNALYKEAKDLLKQAADIEDYLVEKTLNEANVITTTLIGATHWSIRDRKFDVVVIDEAGQGLEPATWVPILKSKKVVLAGDPLQLPPTVKNHEAGRDGLNETLLEKAVNRQERVQLLKIQYRMNDQIMAFSNEKFYNNELSAHESVKNRVLNGSEKPLTFIDTAGCGFEEKSGSEGASKFNLGEAEILEKYLEQLKYETSEDFNLAIISPYRGQVKLLRERLSESEDTTINTIDSFQGQERDTVIISLVRNNHNGEIGFLRDYRRMNVAMTRAKKKLVLIGDSATLGQDKFYADFIEFCEKNDAYTSAWEFMY